MVNIASKILWIKKTLKLMFNQISKLTKTISSTVKFWLFLSINKISKEFMMAKNGLQQSLQIQVEVKIKEDKLFLNKKIMILKIKMK